MIRHAGVQSELHDQHLMLDKQGSVFELYPKGGLRPNPVKFQNHATEGKYKVTRFGILRHSGKNLEETQDAGCLTHQPPQWGCA